MDGGGWSDLEYERERERRIARIDAECEEIAFLRNKVQVLKNAIRNPSAQSKQAALAIWDMEYRGKR
jgi:hypothetical protein